MAQIIKHRRGGIDFLKDVTARKGELIIATGSVGNMSGPWIFLGDTDGVAGAYKAASKIYQGNSVPTISVGSYGSTLDGTPFYSNNEQTLYILSSAGNTAMDLTGNIEGNLISGITINNLTGTTANITAVSSSMFTGSFTGNGAGLYNIPASGVTGLQLDKIADGSVTASIDETDGFRVNTKAEITGSLIVTGQTTLSSANVQDLTENRIVIVGSNGELEDSNNFTFDGTTFNIGQGNFEVDVTDGSIRTSGSITMRGNINIGDNLTGDTVNINGEISSSLIPAENNSFDLGSPENNWRNLFVSGTAYIDILQARQVNFSDLGILEDLTVSGSTFLGNGGDILVVSGSAYYDSLTNNRVIIAGVDGLLEDDANFTFDGTVLNVGQGNLEMDVADGEIRTSGSLLVSSTSELKGAVGINSTLDVTGSAKLNSTLEVVGNTSLNGTLTVTGSATLKDNLSVSGTTTVVGSTTLKDNLAVSGTTTVGGVTILQDTLTVNSTSELKGAVGINSTLDVTGSAQFKSTIDVDGESTLASAIVEDLTQDRIVTVGAGGSLIDSSGFTYNGSVFKIGDGQFEVDTNDGDIRTSGSLTVEGGQTINGNLDVNGVLTVTGNTLLQSNLYVSGNLEILGDATSVTIQSTTVELDDNIIRLNAYSPFERYAGFEVIDSGSTGVSASLVWDGLNDYWMFVSSSGESSKLIGTTADAYGSEISLTENTFPIATGPNTIGDSLLTMIASGTTLAFNTNKFTVSSTDGSTLIAGNLTLSYSGGTDNGTNSSAIVFKNSNNILGYVSTTTSTVETVGLLGYKQSDGVLVFSDLIDGGSY